MATIPVGFAEATFVVQLTGAPKQYTWSLGLDISAHTDATPAAIAAVVANCFSTGSTLYSKPQMSTQYTFVGVAVTKMLETGPIVGQAFINSVGTAVLLPPPSNCSLLVRKNTAAGGRRNRGRCFLPITMIAESSIDAAGFITGGSDTGITTLMTTSVAALTTAGYLPVLFHGEAPFTPTPITSFSCQPLIATQRRRMR